MSTATPGTDTSPATAELCDHSDPTYTRTAHGYLGDAPSGTVQTICSGCGSVLHPVAEGRAVRISFHPMSDAYDEDGNQVRAQHLVTINADFPERGRELADFINRAANGDERAAHELVIRLRAMANRRRAAADRLAVL